MKYIFNKRAIQIYVLALLTFTACTKRGNDVSTVDATDNALALKAYNDLFAMADYVGKNFEVVKKTAVRLDNYIPSCATITIDSILSVATIDFGTSNCPSSDGNLHRGVVSVHFSGDYLTNGTVVTLSLDDYYINDVQVEGLKVITNDGQNAAGHWQFVIQVKNGKIRTASGDYQWEANLVREWASGDTSLTDIQDDIYLLTGSASGTSLTDNAFTMSITSPLQVNIACPYVVSGVLELKPDRLKTRIMDYGNGDCDNEAVVTIGTKSYEIVMQ